MITKANSMSILKRANWHDARWTLALRNWGGNVAGVIVRLKALAPYALIELVLPGGSVMALLLWLYRRRKNGVGLGNCRCEYCRYSDWRPLCVSMRPLGVCEHLLIDRLPFAWRALVCRCRRSER